VLLLLLLLRDVQCSRCSVVDHCCCDAVPLVEGYAEHCPPPCLQA
jgi:hypothetical protein